MYFFLGWYSNVTEFQEKTCKTYVGTYLLCAMIKWLNGRSVVTFMVK